VVWLGLETGLEQVADDLKWIIGNGRNGGTHAKDEFYGWTFPWIESMSYIQVSKNWNC
jgi:hypothetical protein